jgi:hypothetical protein
MIYHAAMDLGVRQSTSTFLVVKVLIVGFQLERFQLRVAGAGTLKTHCEDLTVSHNDASCSTLPTSLNI